MELEVWHRLEGHSKEVTCIMGISEAGLVVTGSRDETCKELPIPNLKRDELFVSLTLMPGVESRDG